LQSDKPNGLESLTRKDEAVAVDIQHALDIDIQLAQSERSSRSSTVARSPRTISPPP
jgi:hypothetical protein